MCVAFYHKTWKSRCVEFHKEENQIAMLRNQIKMMKTTEETERVEGLHRHVQYYVAEEYNANHDRLRKWILGCRAFKRNAPKKGRNTLDAWLSCD